MTGFLDRTRGLLPFSWLVMFALCLPEPAAEALQGPINSAIIGGAERCQPAGDVRQGEPILLGVGGPGAVWVEARQGAGARLQLVRVADAVARADAERRRLELERARIDPDNGELLPPEPPEWPGERLAAAHALPDGRGHLLIIRESQPRVVVVGTDAPPGRLPAGWQLPHGSGYGDAIVYADADRFVITSWRGCWLLSADGSVHYAIQSRVRWTWASSLIGLALLLLLRARQRQPLLDAAPLMALQLAAIVVCSWCGFPYLDWLHPEIIPPIRLM